MFRRVVVLLAPILVLVAAAVPAAAAVQTSLLASPGGPGWVADPDRTEPVFDEDDLDYLSRSYESADIASRTWTRAVDGDHQVLSIALVDVGDPKHVERELADSDVDSDFQVDGLPEAIGTTEADRVGPAVHGVVFGRGSVLATVVGISGRGTLSSDDVAEVARRQADALGGTPGARVRWPVIAGTAGALVAGCSWWRARRRPVHSGALQPTAGEWA